MQKIDKINIRVYGLLINDRRELLISKETYKGNTYTKLPGGGLELGESTVETLKREFLEELNLEIEVADHFYTTDVFQQSAFRQKEQLLSIYYFVEAKESKDIDKISSKESNHEFVWIPLTRINSSTFCFPIDKLVAKKLTNAFL